jgi:hypothetical protein
MKNIYIGKYEIGIYEDGPVGVSVSGGVESALLLYILMTHSKNHIYIYNILEPARELSSDPPFYDVVNTCSKLTGNTNFTVCQHKVDQQAPDVYFKFLKDKLDRKEIGIIYQGITNFPPYEVWATWGTTQPTWHIESRSDSVIKPLFGLKFNLGNEIDFSTVTNTGNKIESLEIDARVYVPFVNFNKSNIAEMYRLLDIEDTLFPKTRSCETEDYIGHCGNCFWCSERLWAFGHLV